MRRKQRVLILFLVLVLVAVTPASADNGPKPYTRVKIENPGGLCYGTLLSEKEHVGPYQATHLYSPEEPLPYREAVKQHALDSGQTKWEQKAELMAEGYPEYAVWKPFDEFADADGYHFLQRIWKVSEESIDWTYMPPMKFKVLLYWPETGQYAVSDVIERYAFYSFFRAEVGEARADGNLSLTVTEVSTSAYRAEALAWRIVFTLAVELLIALLFMFRTKREWLVIILVNLFTQIMLSYFAVTIVVGSGTTESYPVQLAFLELGVAVAEAALYIIFLRKNAKKPRRQIICVAYALVANAASYLLGLQIDDRIMTNLRLFRF